jgi:hypothetical protein
MRKLSSRVTAIHKKAFPLVWFGGWGAFALIAFQTGATRQNGGLALAIVPAFMAILGYFLMKNLLWDLVDEVYDAGSFLLVKNGGREYRVPFSDIVNVNSTVAVNPPRITLRLKGASAQSGLGTEMVFSPQRPLTLNPFAKIPIAEELISRVEEARHQP